MDAELVQRSKRQYADGLVEIVIWRVPNGHGKVNTPDNETRHARSLTPVPPLPKGEGYGSSLREFHVNPIEPSLHRFKYRLVYVVAGVRVVGYDNERGKGDHRHSGALELPSQFVSLTSMLTDFWHDVERSGK